MTSRFHRRHVLAAGLVAALALTGCADDEPELTTAPTPAATAAPSEATIEGRIGEQVEVTGKVNTMLAPYAFTLGPDADFGQNPILVVARTLPDGLAIGDTVTVAGRVTNFEAPGYEADLDIDLVDDEFEDFDNDPAIQASSVTVD